MKDILRLLITVLLMPASFLLVADEAVNSNENDVRVEEEEADVQVDDDDAESDVDEPEESGSFLDNLSAAEIAGILAGAAGVVSLSDDDDPAPTPAPTSSTNTSTDTSAYTGSDTSAYTTPDTGTDTSAYTGSDTSAYTGTDTSAYTGSDTSAYTSAYTVLTPAPIPAPVADTMLQQLQVLQLLHRLLQPQLQQVIVKKNPESFVCP